MYLNLSTDRIPKVYLRLIYLKAVMLQLNEWFWNNTPPKMSIRTTGKTKILKLRQISKIVRVIFMSRECFSTTPKDFLKQKISYHLTKYKKTFFDFPFQLGLLQLYPSTYHYEYLTNLTCHLTSKSHTRIHKHYNKVILKYQ